MTGAANKRKNNNLRRHHACRDDDWTRPEPGKPSRRPDVENRDCQPLTDPPGVDPSIPTPRVGTSLDYTVAKARKQVAEKTTSSKVSDRLRRMAASGSSRNFRRKTASRGRGSACHRHHPPRQVDRCPMSDVRPRARAGRPGESSRGEESFSQILWISLWRSSPSPCCARFPTGMINSWPLSS